MVADHHDDDSIRHEELVKSRMTTQTYYGEGWHNQRNNTFPTATQPDILIEKVEELASLIKDNLYCKHLVLSVEEALVNFLQDDTSPEGVLELQPMSPYHRMLLHRLADIYGFAHESVDEGDDRHLVLERCPDTAIPSILVSDILWQHDEYQSPTPSHHILRKKEVPELKKNEILPSSASFEEREAAYLAARERIFSLHESNEKEVTAPKSRKIPVVARRMIAHALGTKICSNASDQKLLLNASVEAPGTNNKIEEDIPSSSGYSEETTTKLHWRKNKTYDKSVGKSCRPNDFGSEKKGDVVAVDLNLSKGDLVPKGNNGRMVGIENLKHEQIGAAKRIFAHALGLTSGKVNQGSPVKANNGNRACSQDM